MNRLTGTFELTQAKESRFSPDYVWGAGSYGILGEYYPKDDMYDAFMFVPEQDKDACLDNRLYLKVDQFKLSTINVVTTKLVWAKKSKFGTPIGGAFFVGTPGILVDARCDFKYCELKIDDHLVVVERDCFEIVHP